MDGPEELALVVRAILHWNPRHFQWCNEKTQERIRLDRSLMGITPKEIRREVINHVKNVAWPIQKSEGRPEYDGKYKYWYKVNLTCFDDVLPRPLFVEMILYLADEEFSVVHIVNAHP